MSIGSHEVEELRNKLKDLSLRIKQRHQEGQEACSLPLGEQLSLLKDFHQEVQKFLSKENQTAILITRTPGLFFVEGGNSLIYTRNERFAAYKAITDILNEGTSWSMESINSLKLMFTAGKWLKINRDAPFEDLLQRVSPGGAAWVLDQALPQVESKPKSKI